MKKNCIFLILLLTFSSYAVSNTDDYVQDLTLELENTSFVLKNWSSTDQETCLTLKDETYVDSTDCFQAGQTDTALDQLLVFQNDRIWFVKNGTGENPSCLKATGKHTAIWSKQCSNNDSVFEFLPFMASPSTTQFKDKRFGLFKLRSKTKQTCLFTGGTGNSHLAPCDDDAKPATLFNGQYFAAAFATGLIEIKVENKYTQPRNLEFIVKNSNDTPIFVRKLLNIKKGQTREFWLPDFKSYLQTNFAIDAYSPGWGGLHLSYINLRAGDAGTIVINDNPRKGMSILDIQKSTPFTLSGSRAAFVSQNDQNSFKPYASQQTTFTVPEDLVMVFFDKENFTQSAPARRVQIALGGDKITGNYQSARILNKFDGLTFKILPRGAKGALGWSQGYRFLFLNGTEGLFEGVRGFYRLNTSFADYYKKGNFFCNENSRSKPACALLRKDGAEAKRKPFSDKQYWLEMNFKQYNDAQSVRQGEIFYQIRDSQIEMWYSKKNGKEGAIPTNKTSNDRWHYMGLYRLNDFIIAL